MLTTCSLLAQNLLTACSHLAHKLHTYILVAALAENILAPGLGVMGEGGGDEMQNKAMLNQPGCSRLLGLKLGLS